MASGKLILRPCGDIEVQHELKSEIPLSNAYLYINEEVADYDASYLYTISGINEGDEQTHTSRFYLSVIDIDGVKITALKPVAVSSTTNNATCNFKIGYGTSLEYAVQYSMSGEREVTEAPDWYQYSDLLGGQGNKSELLDRINKDIRQNRQVKDLVLEITTSVVTAPPSSQGANPKQREISVTQAYFELEYEDITDIGIHRKVGGVVKAATAAYRKLGGTWQEIDEAEAKSILKNNIITQGGS